jgi:hypothetical protein
LQSYLKDVGITAELVLMDKDLFLKTIHEGWKNGIVVSPYPMDAGLVTNIENIFSSDMNAGSNVLGSAYRPSGWQDKLMAALRTDEVSELNRPGAMQNIYQKLWGSPLGSH